MGGMKDLAIDFLNFYEAVQNEKSEPLISQQLNGTHWNFYCGRTKPFTHQEETILSNLIDYFVNHKENDNYVGIKES